MQRFNVTIGRKIYFSTLCFLLPYLILTISWASVSGQQNSLKGFKLPANFEFGLATAPGHVEDQLDDIWADFARAGGVAGHAQAQQPFRRNDFWSRYQIEVDLAAETGIQIFRLGVDWGRLYPKGPGKVDRKALMHYREMLRYIKSKGMKVMLTLFHHSEPKWTLAQGSWLNPRMTQYYVDFAQTVLKELGPEVHYLLTFNEAQLYVIIGKIMGTWPHYGKPTGPIGTVNGVLSRSLRAMASGHKQVYKWTKRHFPQIQVSLAHRVDYYQAENLSGKIFNHLAEFNSNFLMLDWLWDYLDFIGLNYYSVEVFKGPKFVYSPYYVYADAGRGIWPAGLYHVIKDLEKRFRLKIRKSYMITENGVSDALDIIRGPYLVEHLAAIKQLIAEGVKIKGYIFWTLADNWEWSDGYCPKFGLVEVDRASMDLTRIPRPSYYLFQQVVKEKGVTSDHRLQIWQEYWKALDLPSARNRGICRGPDGTTALPTPSYIQPIRKLDWRFRL